MSYLKKRRLSFGYALAGIAAALREPNFRIQFIAAILVVFFGAWFHISRYEWLAIIGCCASVLSLELVNSAVERLCNRITSEKDSSIKFIKDVSAAAVLVAAFAAAVTGGIVFYPYLRALFS